MNNTPYYFSSFETGKFFEQDGCIFMLLSLTCHHATTDGKLLKALMEDLENMKYIESNSKNPYFNLALEEYIFEHMLRSDSYFMLWQNKNTIVIGKYQNTIEEVNQTFVEENNINVVRRLSGGGAVYHDDGNINFTFIVDQKNATDFNFKKFVVPVIKTIKSFGVDAEFNGRNDITIEGEKISGNSQYIKKGRVMHHGCIMLDSNLNSVSKALKVKAAKFESKNVKSVRSRVTTINEHVANPISTEEFIAELKKNILGTSEVESYKLTNSDLRVIKKIQKEKYETWNWNYGKVIEYTMLREEKFSAGLVTVYMKAKDGRIMDIKIRGDFFGNGDISELEEGLVGVQLDSNLDKVLDELNLNHYIDGIKSNDLSHLIRG